MKYGIGAALVMTILLTACAGNTMKSEPPAENPEPAAERRDPPENAIHVRDDYYMVPAGTDDGGCQQYKPWSASGPVTAAIYYRHEEGTFTLARPEDGCADDG